ncbi:6-bladed beta-propeller [Aquiflexum gelatinilyticum]|uniref:6-bladed beta-propeller n=1 Tax=Aquiflexum gelatinilyticum TaxID=2961943 RepID=A0A9X2T267_9BACT|nr:6-bladed beta-propeller [Aquiflexum gelatinilyticum]MCR9016521.1 6-bladed beta-propeller [Aquiflexum gelatinilyticum]
MVSRNLRILKIFAFVFTFYACEKPVKSNTGVGDEESFTFVFDKIQMDSHSFEIYTLIPLETTQNNFLSNNLTVKTTEDFIFVFDEKIRDGIHKFDQKGRYVSQIISVGEGPERVNSIADFIISGDNIEILSGKGAYSEIIYFSIIGEKIVNKLKLEIIGFSFEKIGETYYIYSSYNFPFAEYRVSKLDLQGNIISGFLNNDYSGKMMPVIERNFFTNNGSTFLTESFSNKIYELTEEALKTKYIIDFGRNNIQQDFFENDMMVAFEKLNNNGFFSIRNHFESPDLGYTNLVFQKENTSELYQVFFDKRSKEIVKNKLEGPWIELLQYPIGMTGSNLLIFSIPPKVLLQNAELLNLQLNSGIEIDDNPVLAYLKLKK